MNTSSARSRRRARSAKLVPIAFVVLAVGAAGTGLLARWSQADAGAARPPASPTASPTALPTRTVLPTSPGSPRGAVRVTVQARPGPGRVRFVVTSTDVPRIVQIHLDPQGNAAPDVRRIPLTATRTAIVFTQVAPGPARWTASTAGTAAVSGTVTVPVASPTSPVSAPVPVSTPPSGIGSGSSGSASSGFASSGSGGPGATRPSSGSPPTTPTTPRPSAKPSKKPSPHPSTKPSPAPDPTGPSAPYDPDDH